MTKVIWAGYMAEDGPQFGTFLGFATGEFLIIALFWHAIFSFIIPIFIFEISSLNTNRGHTFSSIIPSHWKFVVQNRRNKIIFILVFFAGATFLVSGLLADLFSVLIAIIGNLILILSALYLAKRTPNGLNIQQLRIGKKGIAFASLYLAFLYVFLWFVIFPDRIPGLETILLTVGFYLLIFLMIYIGPKDDVSFENKEPIKMRFVWLLFGTFASLAIIWCFVADLAIVIGTLVYLAMMITGPILFVSITIKILRDRLRN
ncbi:MAG: hypothetical protein GF411_18305 [Candidatus Lokiarchaeota archaeon]|nr:hypothetical protein [Candidatus Lokiarchaeota archaeon]